MEEGRAEKKAKLRAGREKQGPDAFTGYPWVTLYLDCNSPLGLSFGLFALFD